MSTKEKSRKRKTSKSKTNATDGTVQLEIGISRSKGMLLIGILSGILLGLMVGVGGAYFGIVPNHFWNVSHSTTAWVVYGRITSVRFD